METYHLVDSIETEDEEVAALIRQRLGRSIRQLRVLRREDGIILQGSTFSYYAKQIAQEAARQLRRLPILANDIKVHKGLVW